MFVFILNVVIPTTDGVAFVATALNTFEVLFSPSTIILLGVDTLLFFIKKMIQEAADWHFWQAKKLEMQLKEIERDVS